MHAVAATENKRALCRREKIFHAEWAIFFESCFLARMIFTPQRITRLTCITMEIILSTACIAFATFVAVVITFDVCIVIVETAYFAVVFGEVLLTVNAGLAFRLRDTASYTLYSGDLKSF